MNNHQIGAMCLVSAIVILNIGVLGKYMLTDTIETRTETRYIEHFTTAQPIVYNNTVVIDKTKTIVQNNTKYVLPDKMADCIKVESTQYPGQFVLNCVTY